MALDTVERVKYFGLRNYHSCGICRLRKGRSVTRRSTRHHPVHIANLYKAATAEAQSLRHKSRRKRLRETLTRHGFDVKKRCRLMNHAHHSLVHVPKFQPTMFGGLCRYEAMHVRYCTQYCTFYMSTSTHYCTQYCTFYMSTNTHYCTQYCTFYMSTKLISIPPPFQVYYINFCDWAMDTLAQCVSQPHRAHVDKMVKACHQFRDPVTGAVFPRLKTILDLSYYTAERRVLAIFYWAHVLGLNAGVIFEPCRVHAQIAVSSLQLLLIATRGHRSYTSDELHIIYQRIGRKFFIHLEAIAQHLDDKRVSQAQKKHEKNPEKVCAPRPWTHEKRYVFNNIYRHAQNDGLCT